MTRFYSNQKYKKRIHMKDSLSHKTWQENECDTLDCCCPWCWWEWLDLSFMINCEGLSSLNSSSLWMLWHRKMNHSSCLFMFWCDLLQVAHRDATKISVSIPMIFLWAFCGITEDEIKYKTNPWDGFSVFDTWFITWIYCSMRFGGRRSVFRWIVCYNCFHFNERKSNTD